MYFFFVDLETVLDTVLELVSPSRPSEEGGHHVGQTEADDEDQRM